MKLLKIISIIAVATAMLILTHELWFYRKYARLQKISMTFLDRIPCRMDIPVKYCSLLPDNIQRTIPVSAGEYGTFHLKISQNGKMYFHRTGLEFCGIAVYHANYELPASQIETQLRQFIEPISKVPSGALKFSLESHFGAFSVVTTAGSHAQTTENDFLKDYFQINPPPTFEIGSIEKKCNGKEF